jgi:hypothetical protein
VDVAVRQSPLTLHATRQGDRVVARVRSVAPAPVTATVAFRLRGAERTDTLAARGSAPRRIPFVVPAWAKTSSSRPRWRPSSGIGSPTSA